jgi:hypothetical protein
LIYAVLSPFGWTVSHWFLVWNYLFNLWFFFFLRDFRILKKNVLDYFFCKIFVGSPALTVLLLPLKFFEFSKPNILLVLRLTG